MENEAKLKTEEKERQKQIHQEVITDTIQRLKKSHDKHQMITPEVWAKAKKGQLLNQVPIYSNFTFLETKLHMT